MGTPAATWRRNSCDLVIEHGVFARRRCRRGRMVREIFEDGEGGHCRNVLLLHHFHRRFAQLRCVIDRGHARLRRKSRPRLALAMHANVGVKPSRLGHGCLQLFLGVLVRSMEFPKLRIARFLARLDLRADRIAHAGRTAGRHHAVRSGLVNLGEVRTLLVLLAHHGDDLQRRRLRNQRLTTRAAQD